LCLTGPTYRDKKVVGDILCVFVRHFSVAHERINDQDVMDYSLNKASDSFLVPCILKPKFIHNYLINTFDWSELAQEWRNHRFSYNEVLKFQEDQNMRYGQKAKQSHRTALDPSKIYIAIEQAFAPETVDLNHVSERIQAAFSYFEIWMTYFEILWKIESKTHQKAKMFYEELIVLEEVQTKAVLRLMKAKLLIETVVAGETISKEKLTSSNKHHPQNGSDSKSIQRTQHY
jgi:hypothetical protein